MTETMSRNQFLVGTGSLLTAAAFGSSCGRPFVKNWDLPTEVGVPHEPPIVTALRYGVTAPSAHNTQPWLFELVSEREAMLFTDPTRLLPRTDPPARQVHMGHGTLLELVTLAATAMKHRADISILPDGPVGPETYGTRATARITLTEDESIQPHPLFDAISNRRSARSVHQGDPPSPAEIRSVVASGTADRVQARVWDGNLDGWTDLVKRAMAVEVEDDDLYAETRDWFRFSKKEVGQRGDGLNVQTVDADSLGARMFLNTKNFMSPTNRKRYLDSFNEAVDSTQAIFFLTTSSNEMGDWISAGRAYIRAQLTATQLGLFMHPVSQPLQEFPQMASIRDELAELSQVRMPSKIQMLVRLGRTAPPPRSPRRPVRDMIKT